ncbi:MAG: zinc/manganese transport system substrate-binding protein [Solirubrobacteraceae bacterium]|nr:zinc/manganese transport system substrate-binding protein [Solirubrobacteraceae bacterium]
MRLRILLGLVAIAVLAAGCGASPSNPRPSGLRVVAAENFWGSLATQLGGARVRVTSIITSPDADPHDYEPRAADARTMAGAQLAIVNGIGYDEWASRLIAANPVDGRRILDVGTLVGLKAGDNPHQWYSPATVRRVIDRIVVDYQRLDPSDAAYFDRQKALVESRNLRRYRGLIAQIRRRYGGTPVGASESIFVPLAKALGLHLVTPAGFLRAVSEGTDPTTTDKQTVDRQIVRGQIRVWVYNRQNTTPDVKRLNEAAARSRIPISTVTETLTPAGVSFQQWQVAQLEALARALGQARAR